MKQKRDRYEMHKYWGKKPAGDLGALIKNYSKEGDTVLDPFSGYGVFCCEAFLMNRNVIANDLNPIANFINAQLLERNVDLELLKEQWRKIRVELVPFVEKWYEWNVDGEKVQLSSILRNKSDVPIKAKFTYKGSRKAKEIELREQDAVQFLEYERAQEVKDWYPENTLIVNSRISAKQGMSVANLFTKRTLACHAKLFSLIEKYSSGNEQKMLKMAFTANLANCSKLVPPIVSRGDMAPGAWMTGFYIGETYIENNVLIYFENRFTKIIKGKEDYLKHFINGSQLSFDSICESNHFKVLNGDAKKLDIESGSIDYVFTDPPYGDAVPYFEQSIIWNSWLQLNPDYENEIVISDSKERAKGSASFESEIEVAFSEIQRVLKPNKYFSLTYHSLSGAEWKAITNACIKNGFELIDFKWLVQKSFTPRQLNRLKSIKGDVLVTFRKAEVPKDIRTKPDSEVAELFMRYVESWLKVEPLETNEIFLRIMKIVFSEKILIKNVDLFALLKDNFKLSDNKKWILNDKFELCTAR